MIRLCRVGIDMGKPRNRRGTQIPARIVMAHMAVNDNAGWCFTVVL